MPRRAREVVRSSGTRHSLGTQLSHARVGICVAVLFPRLSESPHHVGPGGIAAIIPEVATAHGCVSKDAQGETPVKPKDMKAMDPVEFE
eukprot:6229373-Amphidinium_carterae.1